MYCLHMKTITVEAATVTGTIVYSVTIAGKLHMNRLLREAIRAISPTGGIIRCQTHGARKWAHYVCALGAREAVLDQSVAWPVP